MSFQPFVFWLYSLVHTRISTVRGFVFTFGADTAVSYFELITRRYEEGMNHSVNHSAVFYVFSFCARNWLQIFVKALLKALFWLLSGRSLIAFLVNHVSAFGKQQNGDPCLMFSIGFSGLLPMFTHPNLGDVGLLTFLSFPFPTFMG